MTMLRHTVLAGLLISGLSSALMSQTQPPAPSASAKPATTAPAAAKKTATHHGKLGKKGKKSAKPEPVVEAPPPPPPTPEESPAAAPQVNFQNGQLSIRSDNSTLGSILSAIKARTGATVDGPGANSTDRVATQIGPGDPREVLTTLLNSSKYDFILLGAPGNANAVQKIILTARATGGGSPSAAVAAQPHPGVTQTFQPAQAAPDDQSIPDAEIPDEGSQPEVQEEPEPEPPQPAQQQQPGQQQLAPGMQPLGPGIQPQVQQQNGEQQQNPNQPKSPEQLLQELQRMQQQQQQQQQQQKPDEPQD